MAMRPGELMMVAPKKGLPPKHLVDMTMAERKVAVTNLGVSGFRADQVSRQWFGRLSDNPDEWTDISLEDRIKISDALLPTLITPIRTLTCDRGQTVKNVWKLHDSARTAPDSDLVCWVIQARVACESPEIWTRERK